MVSVATMRPVACDEFRDGDDRDAETARMKIGCANAFHLTKRTPRKGARAKAAKTPCTGFRASRKPSQFFDEGRDERILPEILRDFHIEAFFCLLWSLFPPMAEKKKRRCPAGQSDAQQRANAGGAAGGGRYCFFAFGYEICTFSLNRNAFAPVGQSERRAGSPRAQSGILAATMRKGLTAGFDCTRRVSRSLRSSMRTLVDKLKRRAKD